MDGDRIAFTDAQWESSWSEGGTPAFPNTLLCHKEPTPKVKLMHGRSTKRISSVICPYHPHCQDRPGRPRQSVNLNRNDVVAAEASLQVSEPVQGGQVVPNVVINILTLHRILQTTLPFYVGTRTYVKLWQKALRASRRLPWSISCGLRVFSSSSALYSSSIASRLLDSRISIR